MPPGGEQKKVDPFGFGDSSDDEKDKGGKESARDRDRDRRDRDRRRSRSRSRGRGRDRDDRGRRDDRPPPTPRPKHMTEQERVEHEKKIDEFAKAQDLDEMAATALKRAPPEAAGYVLRMDLRGGSVTSTSSRLCLLCLRDAVKAIRADEETKELVNGFCKFMDLSPRIEVMLLSIPKHQREAVMKEGPPPPQVKNPSGWYLGKIQQAKADDMAVTGKGWDCPRCGNKESVTCANCRKCGCPQPDFEIWVGKNGKGGFFGGGGVCPL